MSEKKPYIVNGERVTREEYRKLKLKYEDLRIRVPEGRKDGIKSAADRAGQSVNEYVLQAVDDRMRHENAI